MAKIKKRNYYVVGCGGVATYFLPSFLKTLYYSAKDKSKLTPLTLVDGDIVEQKNIARQVFGEGDINCYKSQALAERYQDEFAELEIKYINDYVSNTWNIEDDAFIFCFCDNHVARKDVLTVADTLKAEVICAANSRIGSHAYYYNPSWKGSGLDPRVRYPEILTNETGSPIQAIGCNTEQKLSETPQTSIANQLAASHALYLWNFWVFECVTMDPEKSFDFWPVESTNTFSKMSTITAGSMK